MGKTAENIRMMSDNNRICDYSEGKEFLERVEDWLNDSMPMFLFIVEEHKIDIRGIESLNWAKVRCTALLSSDGIFINRDSGSYDSSMSSDAFIQREQLHSLSIGGNLKTELPMRILKNLLDRITLEQNKKTT